MIDYVAAEAMADWLDFARELEREDAYYAGLAAITPEPGDYDNGFQPTEQDILDMDTSADPCDHAGWDCVCED